MNLTNVSAMLKKAVKWILLVVVGYYVLIIIVIPGSQTLIRTLLTKKEPPLPTYGLLDQLEFVQKTIGQTKPTFVLNTKNGRLPANIPLQIPVYAFKPMQFSYLAGKNAIAEAAVLGFGDKDLVSDLKGDTYIWRSSSTQSVLSIELNTRKLVQTTDLTGQGINFIPGNINNTTATPIARDLLQKLYRFDTLYEAGTQNVILGSFQGSKLYETVDPREAQLARVDFYRSINEYPVFGPDPTQGLLRVFVRNPSKNPTPLDNPIADLSYWEIVPQSDSRYPIIPVSDAWNAVKNGKGIITNVRQRGTNPFDTYTPLNVEQILIDNIYLAYYETPKYQKYLQPIYVFSGTYTTRGTPGGDVTIYLPAVSGQYTNQTQTTTSAK